MDRLEEVFDEENEETKREENNAMKSITKMVGFIGVIAIVILLAMSTVVVPAGTKAVGVSGIGNIGGQFDEGVSFKSPFLSVDKVRWNTQYKVVDTEIITDDGYNVPVKYEIQYHLVEEKVGKTRVKNPEFKEKITMELEGQLTLVANEMNLTGLDLNQKRSIFNERVEQRVTENLLEFNIVVEDVKTRNVDMPQKVLNAAEKRESARIDVDAAAHELEAEKLRAQKILARAVSEANATVRLAEGQAEAIEILSVQAENMTEDTMNYILTQKYFTVLQDPESNVNFVVVPGGQDLLLDVSAYQNETVSGDTD